MLQTLVEKILAPLAAGVVLRMLVPPLRDLVDANRKLVQVRHTRLC